MFRIALNDVSPSEPPPFSRSIMYGVWEAHRTGGFEGTGLESVVTDVEGKDTTLEKEYVREKYR